MSTWAGNTFKISIAGGELVREGTKLNQGVFFVVVESRNATACEIYCVMD